MKTATTPFPVGAALAAIKHLSLEEEGWGEGE